MASVYNEAGHLLEAKTATRCSELVWNIIGEAFKHSNKNSDSIPPELSLMDFFMTQVKAREIDAESSKLVFQMAKMWGDFVGEPIEMQSLKYFWLEECIEGGKHIFPYPFVQRPDDLKHPRKSLPSKHLRRNPLPCCQERRHKSRPEALHKSHFHNLQHPRRPTTLNNHNHKHQHNSHLRRSNNHRPPWLAKAKYVFLHATLAPSHHRCNQKYIIRPPRKSLRHIPLALLETPGFPFKHIN